MAYPIETRELRFAYGAASQRTGAPPVLDGVSFHIAEGEIFGLLGPSGSGKSTTQKILLGLLPGYTGAADVAGRPVARAGAGFYERIGVSFELPALYLRLTALENLRLFASLYAQPVKDLRRLLAQVGLEADAEKRVEAFSKGMKMRLNLARALVNDPDILFLDEPTTGQDPARARKTRALILDLKAQGKTIFLTTHNMAEAEEVCDRVGFLVQGRTEVIGTPADLKAAHGERRVEVTAALGGRTVTATFPLEKIGENQAFLAFLAGHEILSLHSHEASLDDVFVQVAEAAA